MDLRYAPDLLEEAVTRELLRREERGDASWSREFHIVTDPFYDLPEIDRERRFHEAHAVFFRRLGLAAPIERAAAGPHPATGELCVDRAANEMEEEADLCVAGEIRNVRLRVRVKRFDDTVALEGFVRHELRHIEDMLRPSFEYRPIGRFAERPAEENLVRSRLRVLWNLSAAGAVERSGHGGAATRAEWEEAAARSYPGLPPETRARVVERLWTAQDLAWPRLVELARSIPALLAFAGIAGAAGSPNGPGALCPLCGFPTFDWHPDPSGLPAAALAAVRADFPRWTVDAGGCRQCLETYALRLRFMPTCPR